MKFNRYHLSAILGICCLAMIAWFTTVSGMEKTQVQNKQNIQQARPIPTAVVQLTNNEKTRQFPGSVEAKKNVELAFSIDGLLDKLNAREGMKVKKGEIIARIDQRDFIHSLNAAEANFENLKTELKRSTSLRERQVISQAEYDSIKTSYDVTLAELGIRKKAFDDTVLHAPFDGIIAKRYAEKNEYIKKQTPIVALKDIGELEVEIQVPENLIAVGGVKPFSRIEVNFDVNGEQWYPAFIREHSVQANQVTRTYDVAIGFTTPADVEILPGMTATVRVVFTENPQLKETNTNTCLVPVESVFSSGNGKSYVWLIPEDMGSPTKLDIEIGPIHNNGIEVKGNINEGMLVATAGVHSLHEEMTVRPMIKGGEGLDG